MSPLGKESCRDCERLNGPSRHSLTSILQEVRQQLKRVSVDGISLRALPSRRSIETVGLPRLRAPLVRPPQVSIDLCYPVLAERQVSRLRNQTDFRSFIWPAHHHHHISMTESFRNRKSPHPNILYSPLVRFDRLPALKERHEGSNESHYRTHHQQ